MKNVVGIAALAAALMAGSAIPAFADVVTGAGTQSNPAKLSSYGAAGSLAFPVAGLVSAPAGKSFSYDYYFEFDSAALLSAITASSSSKSGPRLNSQFNVSFSSFDIKNVFASPASVGPGNIAVYSPTMNYMFAANTVYELIVNGTVTDPKGYSNPGSFNGNLSVVSAVPLPTSVAMFGTALVGLGAFGMVRRKKAVAGAAA